MSWDLLQRFFESDVFNANPFLSVSYLSYVLLVLVAPDCLHYPDPQSSSEIALGYSVFSIGPCAHPISLTSSFAIYSRYADHVGIHYVLCNKLRQFPYEDIEFFLPQLCHLIISVDNESMALEEFLLDLCEESATAALLVCPQRFNFAT
jgi:phosphatidylinositol 4-kinase B